MKKIIPFLIVALMSQSGFAQDEHYSNERLSFAFAQHDKSIAFEFFSDGNRQNQFLVKSGSFYFDNFTAGPQFSVYHNDNGSSGWGAGAFARSYFLNGSSRLYAQLDLNYLQIIGGQFTDDFLRHYLELGGEFGVGFPVELGSETLVFEIGGRYSNPLSTHFSLSNQLVPGVGIMFIY